MTSEVTGPSKLEALVELRDVTVRFAKGNVLAVDCVSLTVKEGESLGIVGATGSGKSTLAHLIMGMLTPTSGSVVVGGSDINAVKGSELRSMQSLRQIVLQNPYSSLDARQKVGEIIAEPLTLGRPMLNRASRAKVRERVAELLALVGLRAERADSYPLQFSGGQRQRISIARALAPEPRLILLDEPTSALDVSIRAQILNLLRSLQTHPGVTYLIISHDMITVAYLATTVAVMLRGRVVELGPTKRLFSAPRHPYTVQLLQSIPDADGTFLNRSRPATPVVSGGTSLAVSSPNACRYAASCGLRETLGNPEICLKEDPPLIMLEEGHGSACHFADRVVAYAEGGQAGDVLSR